MQALPSAFFHHVSSAVRILVPRAWMAKSTIVVVPPIAAARVPVSKSSAELVPPKGMSRWVWASMPPGKQQQAGRIYDCFRRACGNAGADFFDGCAVDQQIGLYGRVGIDDGSVLNQN